jgi:hypothetical protein
MYLGSNEPEAFLIFQIGFQTACKIFGVKMGLGVSEVYQEVASDRGWSFELSGDHPITEMRRRGLESETILNELIDIEIEVLKRQLVTPGNGTQSK